jgi:rod shape-determining protein MreD
MTYVFYSIMCFVFVILQTTILPALGAGEFSYDLMLIFIFYLSLFRMFRESLPIVLLAGFIMDNLSGAPFGIYLTVYFWLLMTVKWITGFLRVRHMVLLPSLIASGILIKNLLFMATIAHELNWVEFHLDLLIKVGCQVVGALLTGPFLLVMLHRLHHLWDQWVLDWLSDNDRKTENIAG